VIGSNIFSLVKKSERVLSFSRTIKDYTNFLHDFQICHWWSSKQVCRLTKPEPTFTWDDPVPSSLIQ